MKTLLKHWGKAGPELLEASNMLLACLEDIAPHVDGFYRDALDADVKAFRTIVESVIPKRDDDHD